MEGASTIRALTGLVLSVVTLLWIGTAQAAVSAQQKCEQAKLKAFRRTMRPEVCLTRRGIMTVRRLENIAATIGAVTVLWTAVALAGATPAEKCEAAKLNAAGKYGACRLGAEKKAVLKAIAPDYTKCDAKYATAWGKAETKYGGACPSSGDQAPIQGQVTQDGAAVAAELAGTPLCGNGAIDPEERCDGSNLNGNTCATLGYSGGTLACNGSCQFNTAGCSSAGVLKTGQTQCDQGNETMGACPGSPVGQDGALLKGAARQYVDNGDGTITDNKTGLMWEKLSDDASFENYLNCSNPTSFTWIVYDNYFAFLNSFGGGFAGHTDWRLPNVNELQSIVNYGTFGPAVAPVFNTGCSANCIVTTCSCTNPVSYWSSTTDPSNPGAALSVDFNAGLVKSGNKGATACIRGVRGGS